MARNGRAYGKGYLLRKSMRRYPTSGKADRYYYLQLESCRPYHNGTQPQCCPESELAYRSGYRRILMYQSGGRLAWAVPGELLSGQAAKPSPCVAKSLAWKVQRTRHLPRLSIGRALRDYCLMCVPP